MLLPGALRSVSILTGVPFGDSVASMLLPFACAIHFASASFLSCAGGWSIYFSVY